MYIAENNIQLGRLRTILSNDPTGTESDRLLRAVFSSPECLNRSFIKVCCILRIVLSLINDNACSMAMPRVSAHVTGQIHGWRSLVRCSHAVALIGYCPADRRPIKRGQQTE